MVRDKKIKRFKWLLFAAFLIGIGIIPDKSNAQLLFKPEMEMENYATTGYNLYGRTQIARSSNPRYDYFGNYIMNGVQVFRWEEQKINSKHTVSNEAYSVMDKLNPIDENEFFHFYLDDLVVLNETNKAFSSRFITGNTLAVNFSPLTMEMAAFNGIRWDFDIKENYLSLVASRADNPLWFSDDYLLDASKNRLLPVYLTGGHFERNVGIFNVAANYVNTYKSDSSQSRAKNSITGTVPNEAYLNETRPLQLVIKLEDGSRYDGGGPKIYEIYPIINGKVRKELLVGITKGNWKQDFGLIRRNGDINVNFYSSRINFDPLRVPDFPQFSEQTKTEKLKSNILYKKFGNDNSVVNFSDLNTEGKNYLEADGENYYLFWFNLPKEEDVREVKFKALVENNYVFSISEIYMNSQSNYNTTDTGRSSATYFDTVLQSKGNVKDGSNLKWVEFEYGTSTANMLASIRVTSDIKGFKFKSEYSRNMRFRQFYNQNSTKFGEDAEAWYVNIKKDFGKLTLGSELFKMDPNYSSSFRNVDKAYHDTKSVWQSQWTSDPSIYGNLSVGADPQGYMNLTQVIDTVDDNDDKDQYPDFAIYPGVRDMNGVYPGLDKNGNNRPDTNENDNLMPDYVEPFFLYNTDPDEYDYGQDYNNNGTIDDREDDDKPDYPYNINTKGYHLFGSYGQNTGWKATMGYYNMDRIAGGGKTDVRYAILDYNKFIPFFADLKFSSTFKKIEDDIQDNIFKTQRKLSTTLIDSTSYGYNMYLEGTNVPILLDYTTAKFYDPLRYRNSYVTTSYFEFNIFRVKNLNIGMKLKYNLNHQIDTSFQSKNDLIDRTQVYRAEYKYYLKNLLVNPQVKFQTRKYTNSDGYERTLHEQYFYPIVKVEYPLTLNTVFRAGAQGFPGLNSTVRDLMNHQLDYDTRHYVIMVSNKSFYSGYDFSLNFGYESNWQKFYGIARQAYNRTDRVYFVRLVVGLEPIS